jgi:hypothetical protein
MRTNKNYWLAASGTVAVAGAIMLFSAHRIEAQYSSPVKVLNTSSAPVLNSRIDEPGRIPYRVCLLWKPVPILQFSSAAGTQGCNPTFVSGPGLHRPTGRCLCDSRHLDWKSAHFIQCATTRRPKHHRV